MQMTRVLTLGLALAAVPASADELALTIPPLRVDPRPEPSAWNGLYVGGGVTFAATRGRKGGAGGDAFAGYDHEFANRFVLGVKLDTGYAPAFAGPARGFDFALGQVKLGYDFGRVTPYVYAGGGLARPTNFAAEFGDPATTLNGAFGRGPGVGVTTFGAGVDYRVTSNVTIGVSAGVVRGVGAGF